MEWRQLIETYLSAEAGFAALIAKAQTAPPDVLKAIAPAIEDAANSVVWAHQKLVEAMGVPA